MIGMRAEGVARAWPGQAKGWRCGNVNKVENHKNNENVNAVGQVESVPTQGLQMKYIS